MSNPPPWRAPASAFWRWADLQACNSYTKINFSLFGLYPRKYVPSVPPEMVLVPGDLLYEMSSWTRAIILPLSIVQAIGNTRPTPGNLKVEELFVPGKRLSLPKRDAAGLLFNQVDRAVKVWEKRGLRNIRARAIREAERWIMERTHYSDGLGAIYPSMMYLIMALDSLNYAADHPDFVDAVAKFERLISETPSRLQFQPCFSPVWDTAICMFAMGEAGAPALHGAPRRASPRRPTGCSPRKCGARATGPSSGPTSNPAAGHSNSPTSGIPTSTTPPWC